MNKNFTELVFTNTSLQLDDLSSVNYLEVTVFCLMFVVGAPANLFVAFKLLLTRNYLFNKHELLLLHLTIADSIVLVLVIPTEILWRLTASWNAGDLMCKFFQFYKVFGIYLSSMVVINISISRLLAVYYPITYRTSNETIKKLLRIAWLLSTLFSIPQVNTIHNLLFMTKFTISISSNLL